MALISCKDVALGYDGTAVAEHISFEVNGGDYLCIVGENGSGKTTLMRALLGLIKPISGSITIGDGLKSGEIGYLPQQTAVQRDFPASVREVVLSGCVAKSLNPFFNRAQKQRGAEAISRLELNGLDHRSYRELSGGQQQRVLLARALCATEKLLLLDEPVTGLDPHMASQLYDTIYKLNKEDKIAVIMISHDIDSAIKYADHVLHIGDEPHFFGTAKEYLSSDIGKRFVANEGGAE